MPELIEQMYCSQQIVIPPKFPYILKRYCKAAIRTQPYDLLRWSYEYFRSLAENRPPPVKLRLEYPVFRTEGGLTRGCLKVLTNQLSGSEELPIPVVKAAWAGFCLDPAELKRVLCLCEVHLRKDAIPYPHFIAVAAGLLTKSLTQTMVLLCESLTKEPDGGSAAISVQDFLAMYKLLAKIDASRDVKYVNGYREGETPEEQSLLEEEQLPEPEEPEEKKLREISGTKMSESNMPQVEEEKKVKEKEMKPRRKEGVEIHVYDEEDTEIPYKFYGEPENIEDEFEKEEIATETSPEEDVNDDPAAIKADYASERLAAKQKRIEDMEQTFEEIAAIVDRYKCAHYDLGMVAGRQMSITSAEFVTRDVERDIMDYINDQIAVLPDPDMKKKKAKPEEVEMVRNLIETFIDENIDLIIPETEEVEEEEQELPEITVVYAVPGIGPPVDDNIIQEFEEYALDVCKVQADMFMPRNIRHFMCPALEMYEEHTEEHPRQEICPPKEELLIATGGTIAE